MKIDKKLTIGYDSIIDMPKKWNQISSSPAGRFLTFRQIIL